MARKYTRVHLWRDIDGTLEIAPDDGSDVVAVKVENGVAEVPTALVDHVLAGSHGSYVVED